MKKIILLPIIFMALAFSFTAKAQCIATVQYPSDAVTTYDTGFQEEIIDDLYAGQFSALVGLTIGQNYEFTSSLATDYLTLTDVSDNVIASGLTPLTVNAISIENVRLHIHANASCGSDQINRTITIQCTSCDTTPAANNDCSGAIPLTPGATFNTNPVLGYNFGATGSGELPLPECASYTPDSDEGFGGDVWYSVTVPADGNLTIETNGYPYGDTGMAVYSGACGALALVECNDDGFEEGYFSQVVIGPGDNLAGQTVYIRVWEYGGNKFLPFQVSAYSTTTLSLSDIEGVSNFTYHPNPVKNTLQLKAQSNIQNVSVFNMIGQEVLKTTPNKVENSIDMSALQTGAYFVKVTIDDKTETIRIIKN